MQHYHDEVRQPILAFWEQAATFSNWQIHHQAVWMRFWPTSNTKEIAWYQARKTKDLARWQKVGITETLELCFSLKKWKRKSSPNNSSNVLLEHIKQHVWFQIWANGHHFAGYPNHHRAANRSKTILTWRLRQGRRPFWIPTTPNSPPSQHIIFGMVWALLKIRERARWNCFLGTVDVQVLILLYNEKGHRFMNYAS